MWAIRRASNPFKFSAFSKVKFRTCCTKYELISCYLEENAEPPLTAFHQSLFFRRFYSITSNAPKIGAYRFSSKAGMKSSGEEEDDDLEDGFSELENENQVRAGSSEVYSLENSRDDDDLMSESEHSVSDVEVNDGAEKQDELELSDGEVEVIENSKRSSSLDLRKAIMASPGTPAHNVVEKWIEEGNDFTRSNMSWIVRYYRIRRSYGKALQFLEWVESSKKIEFSERDYASIVDLVAKARSIQRAEQYVGKIPETFRGEVVYRTLLANCIQSVDVKKCEGIFNKMKNLGFPLTSFTCNQLLLLYKRTDKKKIADVLLLMENENVKPTQFTYRILIDAKGQSNDIPGMEQLLETMKAEGMEPDLPGRATLARHYIAASLQEKALAVLKDMEGSDPSENRQAFKMLLPLYAALKKSDEVERIWKACEPSPTRDECRAAIEAWGKLDKIKYAEEVLDKMLKTYNKLSARDYLSLLKVYADHKMLAKGKELVVTMGEAGVRINPLTWDVIVKLYVESGEVEKAASILHKASQQSQMRPFFNTYLTVMEQYSKRGDIHNAEKLFHWMRQAGYLSRLRQFQLLLKAYTNAKLPAYGIRERMKADNIFPNRFTAAQLAQVDAFKKTAVSELLD